MSMGYKECMPRDACLLACWLEREDQKEKGEPIVSVERQMLLQNTLSSGNMMLCWQFERCVHLL
jgi:hypothetical protein